MDLIVAVCRALANRPRLKLLRVIHEHPGITVQVLAERVRFSVDATSRNLKLLHNFHLVQLTPSGRYVRCSPPASRSTSNAFLTEIQSLLRTLFGAGKLNFTLAQVWNSVRPPSHGWEDVCDALVAHCTTFIHLRRLLILRQLGAKRGCALDELATSVRMSPSAARRHLDKLQRRGAIAPVADSSGAWTIARGVGPLVRQRLLGIVLRAVGAS